MSRPTERRQFLCDLGKSVASLAVATPTLRCATGSVCAASRSRVVMARDETLEKSTAKDHVTLLRKMLDGSVQRALATPDAASAWRRLFPGNTRIGIKVNALGFATDPALIHALVAALVLSGISKEHILIWDRFDVELARAGFSLNKSGRAVRCYGTDTQHYGQGYERQVQVSGDIGSCFSRIVSEQVDALISVPVLKDHNLAGVSLGLKNFYGAIHNPNKYHENNCDPYIADVVSHPYIKRKWRLTVCDATRAQFHGGPGRSPHHAWPFGGFILSADVVAADAVAASLLQRQRKAAGLKSLADLGRPPKHIVTAGQRGMGQADLHKIEVVEL